MQEDDLRALGKIVDFFRAAAVTTLILHCYWFCYEYFYSLGLYSNSTNELLKEVAKVGLFHDCIRDKIIIFVLLILSCLGTRGVKSEKITWTKIIITGSSGIILFFLNTRALTWSNNIEHNALAYIITSSLGFIALLTAGGWINRLLNVDLMKDVFNEENESFMQEIKIIENSDSFNLKTRFQYRGKEYDGYINIINPFRAISVLGTPGSGKSYAILIPILKQAINKGYTIYCYDFKYPDLSKIIYNYLVSHLDGYKVKPQYYQINLDNPSQSHRSNPIKSSLMTDIVDAYESAYTIMLNLNKTWIQKQGDFFVESAINLLTAVIWYLKIYKDGKYCTLPHAIELLNKDYELTFPIFANYPELENYISPFIDAWKGNASDQLMGQIASAKIALSRMISPSLYWVMTGDDFSLDINNPEDPKILCIANNPDRQSIYSAALGLYNLRISKLVNKKNKLKCLLAIDELPTIYFRGLDNLIATARSNKVATLLGFQDYSQLRRDYGDKESKVIENTVGNLFSGQVIGDTADMLSKRFGKILQERQSISINRNDKSTSISTQMDSLIPVSKISTLTQGWFVGAIADNYDQPIKQKMFHCEIIVDTEPKERKYTPIPPIIDWQDKDIESQAISNNFMRVKQDVLDIIESECKRWKISS